MEKEQNLRVDRVDLNKRLREIEKLLKDNIDITSCCFSFNC